MKDEEIRIRLTVTQKEAIRAAAKREALSVSAFVLRAALAASSQRRLPFGLGEITIGSAAFVGASVLHRKEPKE